MQTPFIDLATVLAPWMSLFSQPVALYVQTLIGGALLTSGTRTVAAILRTLGLAHYPQFQNYHRVLNRDRWSGLQSARILWDQLLEAFAPTGRIVVGVDEVLERRRGAELTALGIYRDSARSSRSFFVKSSGLRWLSLQLLVKIPWAGRVWGLPVLTALAPSQRYHQKKGRRHQKLTQRASQLLAQVRRWCPERELMVVADSQYAVLELLAWGLSLVCRIFFITPLRLDAALYAPAPKVDPHRLGRHRVKGDRLPRLDALLKDPKTKWTRRTLCWYSQSKRPIEYCSSTAVWYRSGLPVVPIRWVLVRDPQGILDPQAFLCTDPKLSAPAILLQYMHRWPMEVTFQETRAHLGIDGQRQWKDQAIVRTTPCLLGLFSLVTLIAHRLQSCNSEKLPVRTAAWYPKESPTFSDALAWVRRMVWRDESFWRSVLPTDSQNLTGPVKTLEDLLDRAA